MQKWAGPCATGQCCLVFGQWWNSLLRVEVPHMEQSVLCCEVLVKCSDPPQTPCGAPQKVNAMEAHVGDKNIKPTQDICAIPPVASEDRSHVHSSQLFSSYGSSSTHLLQPATASMNEATVLEAGKDICAKSKVLYLVLSRQSNRFIQISVVKMFGFVF